VRNDDGALLADSQWRRNGIEINGASAAGMADLMLAGESMVVC